MAPPRKRGLPKPLPDGFLLTDTEKKAWRLGQVIGQGGFGLIYLASRDVDAPVSPDTRFVIKVEYHENGPLFSELKFYQRAAKPESIQRWTRSRKLDFLGIPTYWGSGLAEHNGIRYRFMAMDRLGCDFQKVCERSGGRLKKATVLRLGRELLDMLEYIHDNEYVHADIKGANLMLGYADPDKVYLADYGLSYRYCPEGVHKEYKEDKAKGHNGTIEYTSLDAHNGVAPSRRGDLQVLCFCLLHWLCGALPWAGVLKNASQVQEAKARLMDNLPGSVQQLSVSDGSTDELARFLLDVKTLGYKERPDYQRLKELLGGGGGGCSRGPLDLSGPSGDCPGASGPAARGKKAGQARGPSRPAVMDLEEEDGGAEARPTPVPACYIRGPPLYKPGQKPGRAPGSSKPKPVAMKMDEDEDDEDDDEWEETKPNEAGGSETAVRRSSRLKPQPMEVDEEDDGDEEDDSEEEEARPKPIASCYIRGPPIGPRPQAAQAKTKPKRSIWKMRDDNVSVVTRRQEVQRRLRPVSQRKHTNQASVDFWEDSDRYPNGQWQGDNRQQQGDRQWQGDSRQWQGDNRQWQGDSRQQQGDRQRQGDDRQWQGDVRQRQGDNRQWQGDNTNRQWQGDDRQWQGDDRQWQGDNTNRQWQGDNRQWQGEGEESLLNGLEEEPTWKPVWNVGLYCSAFMLLGLFLVALVALSTERARRYRGQC